MILPILHINDPHLRVLTTKVEAITPDIIQKLNNMWDTMVDANGIGLAANQVGYTESMFVMKTRSGKRINVINPVLVYKSHNKQTFKEGCLSLRDVYYTLNIRSKKVKLKYTEIDGKEYSKMFDGIDAVCSLHELEHLLGIVYTDYL